ncbi:Protein CBG01362 [Caenorhabditis briggsae]|uniref:Protein CBG01362 n=1 Tax=Caenorhabditis briggsae TaxID=6238 RepID=A8WQ87_CAEBR|nr:Protein CBG01362 [Caenorhabditis briggsae]CAP22645.1 Protein CBG01362 [Caenorhabditis briggsae]
MGVPRFELLCAGMLGFGQLFMNTAFDAEAFILESVIHSVHEREPERIDEYAGYYGQAVIYASFMLTCLFTPSLLNIWRPKLLLVVSSLCFAAFPFGFLFINSYYHYFSTVVLGIGKAFFNLGCTTYLTSHSTRKSIESNVSLQWAIGCGSLIVGSMILATMTWFSGNVSTSMTLNVTEIAVKSDIRTFDDFEIRLLALVLIVVSILAVITVCLLPSADVENCIEASIRNGSFKNDLKLTLITSISPKMLQIVPLCMLCGFNASFLMSIIPTSMHFNENNANMLYIPAIYGLGAGTGEVLMGFFISESSKRIQGFGLKPTMAIGTAALMVYCTLIHASTPAEAPMKPTSEEPLLFYQSYLLIFVIALICGISDCCFNGVRSVICALVMPSRRAQSFSVSRMYQAAACVIIFFFSPMLPLHVYTVGLPLLAILSTFVFFKVVNSTERMERKLTSDTNLEQEKI